MEENNLELKLKYKNITNGKRIMFQYLKDKKKNVKFYDEDLVQLFQHHPDKKKVKTIHYFILRIPPHGFGNYVLFFKNYEDEEEDDISYPVTLRNLFGLSQTKKNRQHKNMLSAFRAATFTEVRTEFLNSHPNKKCDLCNSTDKIQVDHYNIPFSKIFDDFFTETGLTEPEITLQHLDFAHYITDNSLRNRWIAYHDSLVTYRYLCRPCNSSTGDSGHKKRKLQ